MPFIANTDPQRQAMLEAIGAATVEELFADIPRELRCGKLSIPPGMCEQDVLRRLEAMSSKNSTGMVSFLGGGFYDHYCPSALETIVSRGEFATAYTPYQFEMSQGTLQAVYEFQTAICRLTGMEAANASLYDGGTALYEAMMMAMRATGRNRIIVDDGVSPIYRTMIRSYTRNLGIELIETPVSGGLADRAAIKAAINGSTAAVMVQYPNFFGCIDEYSDLAELAHSHGAMLAVSCYPIALGLLKPPGEMGADIVTGEGQSMGLPLSFGGPYLGFMATRMEHIRKMPGRIVGRTVDAAGRQGFVLTLQAREQHIRREKATSNICTNEALCALTSLVYMSLLGKDGFRKVAQTCADKAWYCQQRLLKIPGVRLHFPNRWYFNEFVLDMPIPAEKVIRKLLLRGVSAGFPLVRYWPEMDRGLLIAVTEKRTKEEIDMLAHVLEASL